MYFKYLSANIKKALEYKASFILTLIAQGLTMYIELFTLESLFKKFALLDLYNINELTLGFAIIWFGFTASEIFARGFDHFKDLIVEGKFDILLIRPRNIYLQIIGSKFSLEKIGRLILATYLLISSYLNVIESITILNLLSLLLMTISSTVLFTSILIIGAYFCFKTVQGLEFVNILTCGSRQLAQYPMGIYNKIIRIIFTFIIPITFVNYYPVLFITNKADNILYLFCPLVTFIFLGISILIFNHGIKNYYSTGS